MKEKEDSEERIVGEYDDYVLPPLFEGEMTPEILALKKKNNEEVEKRKRELLKKFGRL